MSKSVNSIHVSIWGATLFCMSALGTQCRDSAQIAPEAVDNPTGTQTIGSALWKPGERLGSPTFVVLGWEGTPIFLETDKKVSSLQEIYKVSSSMYD